MATVFGEEILQQNNDVRGTQRVTGRHRHATARPGRGTRFSRVALAGVAVLSVLVVVGRPVSSAAASSTTGATRGADTDRTGWYPDQTGLTPQTVTSGTFGQLFKTAVNGSVYGQPIVDDGQLLVNTENNYSYGLDPVTGAILWSRQYGTPASAGALGCADLTPNMGITSTPVVDQATNVEYLVDNEYVSGSSGPVAYYMHALNLANNGAEEPGFPVEIQGSASNNPSQTFDPYLQMQRPGLLLLGGVVYVGFGAHCDFAPWQGWIVGVSEAGHLTTMWTTVGSGTGSGAGVWMSGGGLVSDGPGQILFATGNGSSNGSGPIPGTTPPPNLGEAVVRVAVQSDGSLKATDFFSPYDAATLDQNDIDFGSGSPVALPSPYFGTSSIPHLAVEVGKEGYVYLLNRDNLGGVGEGPSGTDDVVGRYGPNGGVWSSPAVWPGDGGWVYIPTASGGASAGGSSGVLDAYQYGVSGSGSPTLNLAGTSSDAFGFGSSAPVVTSNATTSGTALVWMIWSPDASGIGAQLRAYDPVPVNGVMQEVWSAPVGTASKFNPPGVANNRLYVGTRDGNVMGFGSPVGPPLVGTSPSFPATIVGQSSTQTLTLTATGTVTVDSLAASGPFTLGAATPALPTTLSSGGTVTVPVTFTPTAVGSNGGGVTVTTGSGTTQVTLTGVGENNGGTLSSTTSGISFGGIPPNSQSSNTVGFLNTGSQPLTVTNVIDPAAPFSVSGTPAVNSTIGPGSEVVVNVTFAPTVNGSFSSSLEIDSTGGNVVVAITGISTAPSLLQISSLSVNYGAVSLGKTASATFTLTNVGGSTLTITKSKPPVLGPFTATSSLAEGTTMAAGAQLTETVAFAPNQVGPTSDGWIINCDDGQGIRTVVFSGVGTIDDPTGGGWKLNGSAAIANGGLRLTSTARKQIGSAFSPGLVSSSNLTATFTSTIGGGIGGQDGLTFVLANATDSPSSLGGGNGGLGFAGIPGVAVALQTRRTRTAPSANFIGISNGPLRPGVKSALHWVATTTHVPSLRTTHTVKVTLANGVLTVYLDGTGVLTSAVTVGPNVMLGFTGSTGSATDLHQVSNLNVVGGPTTVVGDPTAGGWTINGNASLTGGGLQLTPADMYQAGSAFWPVPVNSDNLAVSFTSTIGGGNGADGTALVLASPTTPPTSLGADGGGLGFSGITGDAVAFDTYQNPVNPSNNFVGVTNGPVTTSVPDQLSWLATATTVPPLRATNTVTVTLLGGVLTVAVDGTQVLSTTISVGPQVLVGFSGGTGGFTDVHAVSNVSIVAQ